VELLREDMVGKYGSKEMRKNEKLKIKREKRNEKRIENRE
jgi:hypothetical protein